MASLTLAISSLTGWAQITVTSTPADGATGVSPSAPVVFTFSAAANPSSTTAFFTSQAAPFLPVNSAWSGGNTVLTCTPMSPFPNDTEITWTLIATDGSFFFNGTFTTGTGGGGGGGSGTNKITTFSAGKFYFNEQTSTGAATPDATVPYGFTASVGVASNLTATAATVTLPTGGAAVSLTQSFLHHEDYTLFATSTDRTNFEATYPQGNYTFNVTATPANVQGTVNLPQSMTQPNAPHVSNFAAAQSIDASQAFNLIWDPFQGGGASDVITVQVTDDFGKTLFATPNPGTNGALTGTATSVVIPAGKLTANATNITEIVFYHFLANSNATTATIAYRATGTQLNLITKGTASAVLQMRNPTWSQSGFGFDVPTTPSQSFTVLYSTDLSLPTSQWQVLTTTNSPGTSVHITVPVQAGAAAFFQLRGGQ